MQTRTLTKRLLDAAEKFKHTSSVAYHDPESRGIVKPLSYRVKHGWYRAKQEFKSRKNVIWRMDGGPYQVGEKDN